MIKLNRPRWRFADRIIAAAITAGGIACSACSPLPAQDASSDEVSPPVFDVLFDGQTLDRWEGRSDLWSMLDGSIVGQTSKDEPIKGNTFLILQDEDVADFDFRCKVRFEGNNSGVQYRSKLVDPDNFALAGYQADLHPKQAYFGMMYGEKTGRGIIGQRGQRVVVTSDGKSKVVGKVGNDENLIAGDWNDLRIVAVGNRMIHQVNGVTTLDLTDDHPDATANGKLGLQLHAGPAMKVEFRNLVLRRLEGADAQTTIQQAIEGELPTTGLPAAEAPANQLPANQVPAKTLSRKVDANSDWLTSNQTAQWIWSEHSSSNQSVWFRHSFTIASPIRTAKLYASCDNEMEVWINGESIGSSSQWQRPMQATVASQLRQGSNTIAVRGKNQGGIAALVMKMAIELKDKSKQEVVTDEQWLLTETEPRQWQTPAFDDRSWTKANVIDKLGDGPWGIPGFGADADANSSGGDPLNAKNIMVPPGFEIERVYQLDSDQGSWVAMAVDPRGRIYACDQGGAGLYRVTLHDNRPASVEKVSVGKLSELSGAQGLVWAFGSLWFHQNGGHLQRLTDSDGDDVLDTAEVYPSTTGGGEHGNHAVIVTEDGNGIYMDGGNAAPLAETEASRVPTWSEGLLLPRMWDSNGHARGKMAPGGWITRLNIESQKQTLHAIGFRNQYDITLNRSGDLFAYDADMEWDMGLPWYRPTRICNVLSGADFGWRSGSGKWPTYYEDSLPPVVEIGPGSPTGLIAGIGTDFPTRYQDALFALDWTFGTIYAIHMKSNGAGYTGTAEPFIYSAPLPLTDAVVAHDGSLVFAVGGRGTESALFRVRYIGDESRANPVMPGVDGADTQTAGEIARAQRRQLEAFHGVKNPAAIATAWPHLSSPDRFLRHAARIAIESQPVTQWSSMALRSDEPQTAITSAVALARMGEPSHCEPLLKNLLRLRAEELDDAKTLGLLRAYALAFSSLHPPSSELRDQIIGQLDPLLPSQNANVNKELIRVLVALQHPGVVAKAVELIRDRQPPTAPDWSQLASRNSRYGSGVQRMIDNPPPVQEIEYAFMLRHMRDGWTLELRREYFTFLNEAAKASGGASYPGYLTRTRDEALAWCSDAERESLQSITGEDFNPVPDFEIAPIQGPGQEWTVESAQSSARGKPDFESGRSLYVAAQCAACHRLGGLGGNIGPDLTSVRNKFDDRYVLEAIIHPSKVISDQYGSSTVLLADGTLLTGLVNEQPNGDLVVYPNQSLGSKEPLQPIEVEADEIEDISESKVSQMPAGLLNNLNAKEIRDLMGYLMSGGDPKDKRYH